VFGRHRSYSIRYGFRRIDLHARLLRRPSASRSRFVHEWRLSRRHYDQEARPRAAHSVAKERRILRFVI